METSAPQSGQENPRRLARLQRRYRRSYDAASLLVYVLAVYVWGLYLPAFGPDFALLDDPRRIESWASSAVFGWELRAFGAAPAMYHALNLGLLYAGTLIVYALTRLLVPKTPIWIATLAAALFMANPVHTDAVLLLSGVSDLLPAVVGLGALTLYVWARRPENAPARTVNAIAAWLAVAAAVAIFRELVGLGLAVTLYDGMIVGPGRRARVLSSVAGIVLFGAGVAIHWSTWDSSALSPAATFAPLYFVAYPIGFLPENARLFYDWPVLGWLSALVVALLIFLVYRKTRHAVMLFGIFAAFAFRVMQGDREVDPVHLSGGGSLLIESALLSIALVVVFARMMSHPKWRTIVITGTTLFALFVFVVQARVVFDWRHAANQVRAFQAGAAHASSSIGILPDYQHFKTAPMNLSETISYNTPFSRAIAHQALLELDYHRDMRVEVETYTPDKAVVRVELNDAQRIFPRPWALLRHDSAERDELRVEVVERGEDFVRVRVTPLAGALPLRYLSVEPY